jgi:hypothetical protein
MLLPIVGWVDHALHVERKMIYVFKKLWLKDLWKKQEFGDNIKIHR